ncbi:dihydroorotate dehydrogenase electron transfer subunit [Aquipuribacter sp. MA13-13]|uniref:iron-sulfur cluster-binding protein n=1 Tax=Aquipuribacter sp. MA13-13 TaxID=3440840 RepID=UPI003EECAD00
MTSAAGTVAGPAQVRARVVAAADTGVYRHLVLAAPAASRARPGQFVALAVGDPTTSSMLLRRAFSVHRADPVAGTVEVVVAAHGPGTGWVCGREVGDEVDVVGPLGTGFDLPTAGRLVLVGGGYGSAPFAWTAASAAAGVVVDAVVGAGDAARLCDVEGIRAAVEATGGGVHVTTDDGSAGRRGRVTDALADLLGAGATGATGATGTTGATGPAATVVAACGPMAMLAAVAATASRAAEATGRAVGVQVAVEEAMACGIGICMTCVLPVRGADGLTRMLRACTEGPVLDADRVRWDCVGAHGASVPADAVGAPEGGAA